MLADALPRRWTHVQAVAAKAQQIAHTVRSDDTDTLVAAAWLHDVGYAPGLVETGFHSLDGARWLKREGWSDRVCNLVAYHSCAAFEAEERGLADQLRAEFSSEDSAVTDALWYADMTTGPDGQDFDVRDRLAEVRKRYGPDHLVTRFWARAEPTLLAAVHRTDGRLAAHPI
ncbi:HD domain-containing protein [Plantactinospora sp. B24E8]|uniref:HD domain-containing protein n=1 Tax=Plantactinospora sp. B24E8 TaxID=3153567 RepID=UPI00325EB8C3